MGFETAGFATEVDMPPHYETSLWDLKLQLKPFGHHLAHHYETSLWDLKQVDGEGRLYPERIL